MRVIRKKMKAKCYLERHLFALQKLKNTGVVPRLDVYPEELTIDYEYVDGAHLEDLNPETYGDCLESAGAAMALIHSFPFNTYGFVDSLSATRNDWWSIQDERFDQMLKVCREHGAIGEDLNMKIDRAYKELRSGLPLEYDSCLSHCDFSSDNLLFWRKGDFWKCTVIDFDHAQACPPHYDFGRVQFDLFDKWPMYKHSFCDGYKAIRVLPDLERLMPIYRVLWPLDLMAWGCRNGASGLVRENVQILQEID